MIPPSRKHLQLVETAGLNGVDPEAWLTDIITRIADHPARRVAELLRWNYRPVKCDTLTGRLPQTDSSRPW